MHLLEILLTVCVCSFQSRAAPAPGFPFFDKIGNDAKAFMDNTSAKMGMNDPSFTKTGMGCSVRVAFMGVGCNVGFKRDEVSVYDGHKSTLKRRDDDLYASIS